MKHPCSSLLFALALLLSVSASATSLPVGLILQLVEHIPAKHNIDIPDGLVVPLTLHTVLNSSQICSNRKVFLRVSEDVILNDRLLFAGGAIALGYIRSREKDSKGNCVSIGIELVQVQSTDGRQVSLSPVLISIKTIAVRPGAMEVQVETELQGLVQVRA